MILAVIEQKLLNVLVNCMYDHVCGVQDNHVVKKDTA